jgi:glucan-binding YG repeat protein
MNESGTMVTGWINWKSKWYYCGNDGAMYTNTTTPDGYKVGSDGAWVE